MAEKKESGLSLVGMGQNDIPALLEKVTAQINSIKGGMPSAPKATGELAGFGKIENIKTVESLLKAHSMVVTKEAAYYVSAKEIMPEGVKTPTFKLNGSSATAWKEDISGRIRIVANQTKLDKLNQIKVKLESNLSAEAKLAKDLADVASILTE